MANSVQENLWNVLFALPHIPVYIPKSLLKSDVFEVNAVIPEY